MIPKNVLAIWRRNLEFSLKSFNMVVNTAFCAFREKNSTWVFPKQFVFLNDYRALIETFSIFWQNFPKVVNSALYVSKVTLRGNFSLKMIKKPISSWRMSQKTLFFSYQKVPWTTDKTDLFPSRPTIWMNWFSLENISLRIFSWILSGKIPTGLWNKYSTLTEQQLRKVVSNSNGIILEFAFSLWKISQVLAEKNHEGCQYYIFSAEMINFRKNIFFSD